MKFTIERQDEYSVFTILENKIEATIATELKSELTEIVVAQDIKQLLINLTNVTFIDSAGLSAFLIANRSCQEANGIMVITNVAPQIKKVMEITRLTEVLNIAPSVPDARKLIMAHVLENAIFGDDILDDEDDLDFATAADLDDSDE